MDLIVVKLAGACTICFSCMLKFLSSAALLYSPSSSSICAQASHDGSDWGLAFTAHL